MSAGRARGATATDLPAPAGATPEAATCPIWCTEHALIGDLDYHATAMARVAGCDINMTDGTFEGDVRIFGLYDLGDGESISLDEAQRLAFLLLGYVSAARAGDAQ